MLNLHEVLTSAQTTLNDDSALCGLLLSSGKDRVYIGPDFPQEVSERFISLAILSNIQDIDPTEIEFSTLSVSIGVKVSYDSDRDLDLVFQIAKRVNTLFHNVPTALTLTDDLISHISREGSLPPDTDRIGEEDFLISQERFELLTTTKG